MDVVHFSAAKFSNNREINQLLESLNFDSSADAIFKTLSLNPETEINNYVGHGNTRIFFTIPGASEWLMSFSFNPNSFYHQTGLSSWLYRPEKIKGLLEQQFGRSITFKNANDPFHSETVGQPLVVATSVNGEETIGIHRRLPGVVHGVTEQAKQLRDKGVGMYKEKIRLVANLPQEAFDRFAADLERRRQLTPPVIFDPGANNLLIDNISKTIYMIGPSSQEEIKKYGCYGNHLAGMASALLDSGWFGHRMSYTNWGDLFEKPENQKLRVNQQNIFKKCLIAAFKAKLPHDKAPFTDEYHPYHNLPIIFDLCGLTKTDCDEALKLFDTKNNALDFETDLDRILKIEK